MMKKKKKLSVADEVLLGAAVAVLGLGALNLALAEIYKPAAHRNPVDATLALYSDKRITANAVAADPRFGKLTFEPVEPAKAPFLQNQVASVAGIFRFLFRPKVVAEKESGTWIWTPVRYLTPEYTESILSQAKDHGIDTVYLSIDSYLDIFAMQESEEKDKKQEEFDRALTNFIKSAHEKGLAVDAEAGWRNWAEEGHIYKALAVVQYVKDFNATSQYKFRGFQYDVEPYLLDEYKQDPAPVLRNFVALIDQTRQFLGDSALEFSVVLPDFYDGKDEMTPKFSYNGKKDYAFGHVLRILDQRAGSSIILMSYRAFAEGPDGSIEISKNEMRTAKNRPTRIIIAQETGDFPPPYITFHGSSKEHLFGEIGKLKETFSPYSNFGGIAIHYANAFLALK